MKTLILYHSKTGHTLEAAHAMAEGIRSAGSEVELVATSEFQPDLLAECDALVVGSPCRAGSITSGGVAKAVSRALDSLPPEYLKGKRGGGISVHATKGGETTVGTIGRLLSRKGCDDYRPGPVAKAGVAFSLWKGRSVTPRDEDRFRAFGAAFVD